MATVRRLHAVALHSAPPPYLGVATYNEWPAPPLRMRSSPTRPLLRFMDASALQHPQFLRSSAENHTVTRTNLTTLLFFQVSVVFIEYNPLRVHGMLDMMFMLPIRCRSTWRESFTQLLFEVCKMCMFQKAAGCVLLTLDAGLSLDFPEFFSQQPRWNETNELKS